MRRILIALLLLAALAPAWPAASTDWNLTVNDSAPYVGDEVTFTVSTTFPIYRDYVLLEIRDPLGQVMDTEVMQLDGRGRANVTWESPLNSDPGRYEVSAWYRNSLVANMTLEMLFSEADYQAKLLRLLEHRIEKQEAYNRQTRMVANAAYNRADYYIQRWGLLTMVLDVLMIVLMIRVGIESYAQSVRGRGEPLSKAKLFWHRTLAPQVDGDHTMIEGHEDMIRSVPEHVRGTYCSQCHIWIREGVEHEHPSPTPPKAAPPPPPASPARRVAPRRVVRRRVAGPPPPEMKVSKGVGQ
jgi:hypothetical protein